MHYAFNSKLRRVTTAVLKQVEVESELTQRVKAKPVKEPEVLYCVRCKQYYYADVCCACPDDIADTDDCQ